jgi:hypothetical protein
MAKKRIAITLVTTVLCFFLIVIVILVINQNNEIKHLKSEIDDLVKSGYKVGDNAIEVLDYYRNKYEEFIPEPVEAWGEFEFKLSDTEIISFRIDSTLNEDSVISSIWLH